MTEAWMSSEAAAARLGIKPQTLYAYVSRGLIGSERIPGSRRSRFWRADVERLAARQRAGGRAGALELVIETELTLLDPGGRLAYRGWDVVDAVSAGASFEEVATWLWSGERATTHFSPPAAMLELASQVMAALAAQPLMDRLRASVAAVRSADPLRHDRRPEAVGAAASGLIATLVHALPSQQPQRRVRQEASLAAHLWPRLSPLAPTRGRVRLLNAALVLLADHDLAASTLAARIAASTWADPYLVVQAGLAALGGPLHGGASARARQLIREVDAGASAPEAIGRRLAEDEFVPGFGHRIYEQFDPRAEALLGLLEDAGPRLASEQALLATMRERRLPFPNVDFALGALAERHQMVEEAGEIIFTTARIAGWLAHAAEEYRHRLRFRPRAVYTGP